jgi:hypothetical protein
MLSVNGRDASGSDTASDIQFLGCSVGPSRHAWPAASSGCSWPDRVPAWGRPTRLDREPELQGLRDTPAIEVDIGHLPVVPLAVVRPDILQAHRDRVGSWVPAGYGTWLGPVDVELAARPCCAAAPVPPGQPPGDGRAAHADVDDTRTLNHPGPAGYVRLHPHLGDGSAGLPGRGRVNALASRTACRQGARHSGRCDDAQESGCAAHRKSAPLLPQAHASTQRKARAGRPADGTRRHFTQPSRIFQVLSHARALKRFVFRVSGANKE